MGSAASSTPIPADYATAAMPSAKSPALMPMAANTILQQSLMFQPSNVRQSKGAFGAQVALTVLVTSALFMLFILAFFFLLTRNVEQKVVSTSVARVVTDLSKQVKALVPASQLPALADAVQAMQAPDASKADAEVAAKNAKLTKDAGIAVGCSAGVVLIIALVVFLVMKRKRGLNGNADNYPDPKNVCFTAAIGFLGVAVCELVFLYGVAAQYQPLDTNATRATMLAGLITAIERLPTP